MPLQAFMPLQACLATAAEECAVLSEWLLQPPTSGAPATSAATAAAINAFFSLRPMVPLRSGRSDEREEARRWPRPTGCRLRKPGAELDSPVPGNREASESVHSRRACRRP